MLHYPTVTLGGESARPTVWWLCFVRLHAMHASSQHPHNEKHKLQGIIVTMHKLKSDIQ